MASPSRKAADGRHLRHIFSTHIFNLVHVGNVQAHAGMWLAALAGAICWSRLPPNSGATISSKRLYLCTLNVKCNAWIQQCTKPWRLELRAKRWRDGAAADSFFFFFFGGGRVLTPCCRYHILDIVASVASSTIDAKRQRKRQQKKSLQKPCRFSTKLGADDHFHHLNKEVSS